jgi:quinol monooxygenase YgiN
MATDNVKIVARITARADAVDELKAVLERLVAPTRAEKGCLRYELSQALNDSAEFVFVEEWASAAAIDAHMVSAHVKDAFARAGPLLACAPDIRKYRALV